MLTEPMAAGPAEPASDRRAWRRIATGFEVGVVLAWALLVLRDQYGVASLQAHSQFSLDELFLAAVAAVATARAISRRHAVERRLFVARLALTVVMTLVALVAAEYLARFEFRHARTSGHAGDYIARNGGWSPGPSNSLGFREREIPPKTADRYRIVVVGDSFTWGQGIERDERFSNLLEHFLGPRYEVFNFAIPGDNMPEHLTRLAQALAVSPDFVLLQIYINDFETREMVRPRSYPLLPPSADSQLLRSSLLYLLMQNQWAQVQEMVGSSESYVHYMERNLRDPQAPNARASYGQLHEFFDRARAAGVAAGAVLFPATDALGPNGRAYPFGYLHDGVRQTCTDEHVRCLDLLPMFSTFPDPRATWVSPFDAHPNAIANRRAAELIQQTFGPAWQR
jgi:lysophospholipase L1-like esterase